MNESITSFEPLFSRKWLQVYQQLKGTTEQFGVVQELEYRKEGKYLIFKNKEYFKKRSSAAIQTAFRTKKIDAQFDQKAFNFKKINQNEYLFQISQEKGSQIIPHTNGVSLTSSFLIINGCPLTVNHSLFVPSLSKCLPQIINESILTSILSLLPSFPDFKIAYNSQGAGSTVNHFHAQLMQLSHLLPNNRFYFEDMASKQLIHYSEQNITISSFVENNAVFFKLCCQQSQLNTQKAFVARKVMNITEVLLKQSVPHNIIITDASTLYVIARNYASPQKRYGWLEFSGLFIASSPEEYCQTQAYFSASFNQLSGIDLQGLQNRLRREVL